MLIYIAHRRNNASNALDVPSTVKNETRSSADADNALDANEAVPNKWRADGTHNTYQSY